METLSQFPCHEVPILKGNTCMMVYDSESLTLQGSEEGVQVVCESRWTIALSFTRVDFLSIFFMVDCTKCKYLVYVISNNSTFCYLFICNVCPSYGSHIGSITRKYLLFLVSNYTVVKIYHITSSGQVVVNKSRDLTVNASILMNSYSYNVFCYLNILKYLRENH